jgi:hypothetical protein
MDYTGVKKWIKAGWIKIYQKQQGAAFISF